MPTCLHSGVRVYNLTPHDLHFEDREGIITAPSDGILNAEINYTVVEDYGTHKVARNSFEPTREGMLLIESILKRDSGALIVGSFAAAQAYPDYVVAIVPIVTSRKDARIRRTCRSNRFTTFKKEENYA